LAQGHIQPRFSAIEYGVLAASIALVIIAAVMTPGTNLNSLFSSISTSI
jgi:Flp pilus assembly pilin Flp